jgi:hypothetical protein
MANTVRTNSFLSINKDFLGFLASMLCAVHCAALPLILTVSAFSGLSFLGNHMIEFVFLGISLIIATWSLIPSYKKHHHNIKPLIIVGVGFVFLISSRFLPHGFTEHFITAIGGFVVAISHIVNWRLVKSCC